MKYEIKNKPNPEFAGYPWHDEASDPTQWHIQLIDEKFDSHNPVWVMWPSRDVYILWKSEATFIGKAEQMEEDDEPHAWMFESIDTDTMNYGYRGSDDGFNEYYEHITETIDAIINDNAMEWPSDEEYEKLFPSGGALRPPLTR